jgi:hypothetical protein
MTDSTTATVRALLGSWGRPVDGPAWAALIFAALLAVVAIAGRGRFFLGIGPEPLPTRTFLRATAFTAALLSLGYIAHYLQGGPRIVDATTYFLQGRALSEGSFTWSVPDPSASFRGRFLLYREDAGGVMGGIFPPGYPLLLAAGFTIGAPMIVGPLLAAAILVATYRLTRAIAQDTLPRELVEPTARAAALLSLVCAALRYHTADTMSHGAAALGVVVALERALAARRTGSRWAALACGLAVGYVAATRPVSALAIGAVSVGLLARRAASLPAAAVGLLPGLLLLGLHQHAVTGAWLTSSQRMYYALADGPPGCFRWGFGQDVGCLHEHGDFVAARLPSGYGLGSSLGTTMRRLRMHLSDVANFEPLALLVLAPLAFARKRPSVIAAALLVLLQIAVYAPFYFDGSYPGGGARFFADVLPVEHALVAVAAVRLAGSATRGGYALLAFAVAGFAVHAAYEHQELARRDGGRPMFEPDVLARAQITHGLVYVDTDHGFALGYDPGARTRDGIVVARLRNDDRDRLLRMRLGLPQSFLYRFEKDENGVATPSISSWGPLPADPGTVLRFEAEAEWPPLSQEGGFAAPAWTDGCASQGRALVVTPTSDGPATARIALPVPEAGRYRIEPRVVHRARVPHAEAGGRGSGMLRLGEVEWSWPELEHELCQELVSRVMELAPPYATVTIEARGGPIALDRITIQKEP